MSLATKCWTFVLRQCQFRARFFLTIVFLFTFLGQNSFSQSLEQLEAEILGSSPDFDEVIPEADPEADSQSKEDDYAFSEVTEQEHLEQNLEAEEDALEKVDELVKGPRQIPFEHILVVQNKYVQKEGSHEITPFSIAIQPADSFRKQLQMGLSYAYHVNDSFALELLHLLATTNLKSGFSEELLDNTGLETERVEPVLTAGLSLQWTPFKGKSASLADIFHFEGYLLGGGGFTKFEEESSAMIMGGFGVRMFLTKKATLKVELRDYYDLARDSGNRLNVLLGASVFFGGEHD